jgi:hypothetical protein
MKGSRTEAARLLAPDSLKSYDQMDMRSLMSVTIDKVTVTGDKATVEVTRSFAAPITMTMPWTDTWKFANGDWYFTLPALTYETPFGVMKPNEQPVDEKTIQQQMERANKVIDPDQAVRQVEKYAREHPEAMRALQGDVKVEQTMQLPAGNTKNAQAAKKDNAKKDKKSKKKGAEASQNVKQNGLTSPASSPRP